jgi:hypothetical protein
MMDRCIAMGQLQWHWGRGNRSNCDSNGAPGQEQQEQQEQWGNSNDRSVVPIAMIDRVDVGVGRGHGRFPCFLIQKVSECQIEVRINR